MFIFIFMFRIHQSESRITYPITKSINYLRDIFNAKRNFSPKRVVFFVKRIPSAKITWDNFFRVNFSQWNFITVIRMDYLSIITHPNLLTLFLRRTLITGLRKLKCQDIIKNKTSGSMHKTLKKTLLKQKNAPLNHFIYFQWNSRAGIGFCFIPCWLLIYSFIYFCLMLCQFIHNIWWIYICSRKLQFYFYTTCIYNLIIEFSSFLSSKFYSSKAEWMWNKWHTWLIFQFFPWMFGSNWLYSNGHILVNYQARTCRNIEIIIHKFTSFTPFDFDFVLIVHKYLITCHWTFLSIAIELFCSCVSVFLLLILWLMFIINIQQQ